MRPDRSPDQHCTAAQGPDSPPFPSFGRHSLREVLLRVDSKEFGSNAAVVVEYLKALNVTGKISEYSTSGTVPGLLLLAGEVSCL